MGDFDWKKLVGSVAPALATALGGPLVGVATQAISTALLGKPDAKEAEIVQALQSGGADALLKLKQADQDFAVKMRQMDIDLEKMAADDRASAREREKTVKDNTPKVLAYSVVGGFLAACVTLIATSIYGIEMQAQIAGLVGTLVGYLSAKSELVLAYYFGSSAGSEQKNQTIDKLLEAGS